MQVSFCSAPPGLHSFRRVFRGLSPTAIHIESLRDSGTRPSARSRTNHRPQRRRGSESMIARPSNYCRRASPAGTNMNSRGCQPTGGRPMTARPRRGRTGRPADVRSSLLRVVPEFTVWVVWQARRCAVLKPVAARSARSGRAQRLPRRVSPSGLLRDNRPPANFKTGS